jgi:hypothetical protein
MGRHARWAGLLALTFLLPAFAVDDKAAPKADEPKKPAPTEKDEPKKDAPNPADAKGKDAPKPEAKIESKKTEVPEKPEPKEKLIPLGQLVGKLMRVEGAQRYITIQLTQSYIAPSGGGRPTGKGRPNITAQVKQSTRDVELQASDDLIVRVANPPTDFDDKGRPKRRTAQELKELKGPNPKLPGYNAEFESLKPDQIVQVTVAKKKDPPGVKGAPRTAPKVVAKTKKAKDDEPDEPPEVERPLVTMILIIAEPVK